MAPVLEQAAYATVAKYESRVACVTFDRPTKPGSLIVVVESAAGALPVGLDGPDGYTRIAGGGLRDIEMAVWYKQNAPRTTQVQVGFKPLTPRSIQLRAFEYSGVAQSGALDRVSVRYGESARPYTGEITCSQNDSLVCAFAVNQYDTPTYGWAGALARLFEGLSPQQWSRGYNVDWERSRLSCWHQVTSIGGLFWLLGWLSCVRRWVCVIICFKGGSLGPARMTSTAQDPVLDTGVGGTGSLTVFGPLKSTVAPPVLDTESLDGARARIGPFFYQYRLGGWSGLLIGSDTEYLVEGTDGLGGWTVRTSDDDLPRGDGSLRGIDLESSRQVVFTLNIGRGRDDTERNMDRLYRALVPQRDSDWELLWRHPTGPLKMMRVRPVDLIRERNSKQLLLSHQAFALKAVDPRHYAAVPTTVDIPVSPTLGDPVITKVFNEGNAPAYPIITLEGPTSGPPVTQIELVNTTALVTFTIEITLPRGSVLVGDMDARITGAARSAVTLDGDSRYGAWQLPRDPFRIESDPAGLGGFNEVYLRTTPVGAPVRCSLSYRDTWAG